MIKLLAGLKSYEGCPITKKIYLKSNQGTQTKMFIEKLFFFLLLKNDFFPKCDMGELVEQFLKLDDVKFEKKNFHFAKKAINLGEVDIEKISLSIQLANGKNKEVHTRQFLAYKTCKNINQYSSNFQK